MDPDILARDQFVEYVRDMALRRKLKSPIRQRPAISFLSLRQEGIRWAEEGERLAMQLGLGLDQIGFLCKNNLRNSSCKLKAL